MISASLKFDKVLYSHRRLCRHFIGSINFTLLKQCVNELNKHADQLYRAYCHIEDELTDIELQIAHEVRHDYFAEIYSNANNFLRESQQYTNEMITRKLRIWSHTPLRATRSVNDQKDKEKSLISGDTVERDHDANTVYNEADEIMSSIDTCLFHVRHLLSPLESVTDVFVKAVAELESVMIFTSILISDKQHELSIREWDLVRTVESHGAANSRKELFEY